MADYFISHRGDGESYWQPEPAKGYVEIQVSAERLPGCPFSSGTQTLPPGGFVREHAHDSQYECITVLSGSGTAFIGGERLAMLPGTAITLAPRTPHRFVNDGGEDLVFRWTISPGGLEAFFREIGRPRTPGEPAPVPFARPADSALDGRHQMRIQLI